jgi:hypothetical protein
MFLKNKAGRVTVSDIKTYCSNEDRPMEKRRLQNQTPMQNHLIYKNSEGKKGLFNKCHWIN